jgi:hypothetical protein
MPEWLFALILLVCLCGLGVYVTKGIDGFQPALLEGLRSQTPSSFNCSSYTGSDCNTVHSCCRQACNADRNCLLRCGTNLNLCTSRNQNSATNSGNTTIQDLNTVFNNYAYGSLMDKTPTSIHVNSNSPYLYSPTDEQLAEAQGGSGTTPYSMDMETSAGYKSIWNTWKTQNAITLPPPNPNFSITPSSRDNRFLHGYGHGQQKQQDCVPPALRDLIRSDMDEAVHGLVEKEVGQFQNEYQL